MFGKTNHSNRYKAFESKLIKNPSNTKQMNRVKNIRIKVSNYKAVKCFEI